jgi:thioredoxin reductase
MVKTNKDSFSTRILVVASGTKPKKFTRLEIPEEISDKVFHEVYPLVEKKGKHIAIIGGGDAAFDFAINLSRANRVTILNRSKTLKCLPLLWERVQRIPEIRYLDDIVVEKLEPGDREGLRLICSAPEGVQDMEADYLIGAIGREPNLDFLSKTIEEEIEGLQSSGVLVLIGDVKNEIYRQTSIAVGDGVRAAMQIAQLLFSEKVR